MFSRPKLETTNEKNNYYTAIYIFAIRMNVYSEG